MLFSVCVGPTQPFEVLKGFRRIDMILFSIVMVGIMMNRRILGLEVFVISNDYSGEELKFKGNYM